MKNIIYIGVATILIGSLFFSCQENTTPQNRRPNILFAMSDNQSYPHAGIYDSKFVKTPGFDLIAKEGILFQNAFAASPGCAPSPRAPLLTDTSCRNGSSFA